MFPACDKILAIFLVWCACVTIYNDIVEMITEESTYMCVRHFLPITYNTLFSVVVSSFHSALNMGPILFVQSSCKEYICNTAWLHTTNMIKKHFKYVPIAYINYPVFL